MMTADGLIDQSIVSTAIPVIVSDFQAFDQVAWIITAYFCECRCTA